VPQIEVTFDIDANGMLNVSAKDKATSKAQHITITASSGLSADEIATMVQDAEVHAEEDRKRRDLIGVRNSADSLIYTAERALRDSADTIDAELRATVESQIRDLRAVVDTESVDAIRNRTAELSVTLQQIGQAAYDATAADDVADGEKTAD
jgi:molecular chaperone DnaK